MSDDSQERTEEATPKRKEESREKGVIVRSRDLNTLLILLFSGLGFIMFGRSMSQDAVLLFQQMLNIDLSQGIHTSLLISKLLDASKMGIYILMPFFICNMIATFLGPLLVGRISFSSANVRPKFERLDPIKGLGRMVSLKSLMELLKSILKILLVATIGLAVFHLLFESVIVLSNQPLEQSLASMIGILKKTFFIVGSSLVVIAFIDIPFQISQYNQQIKMTKQEVRDELKETDVRPEIKNKLSKIQREISRRRMMSKIPEADVVITNPTHFAVALKYDEKTMKAPILLAKGADHIAHKIRQIANHHQIPILEIPMLSRAIYYNTELDEAIPSRLYVACAQVLGYVYRLKLYKKGKSSKPKMPKNVPVPKDMVR